MRNIRTGVECAHSVSTQSAFVAARVAFFIPGEAPEQAGAKLQAFAADTDSGQLSYAWTPNASHGVSRALLGQQPISNAKRNSRAAGFQPAAFAARIRRRPLRIHGGDLRARPRAPLRGDARSAGDVACAGYSFADAIVAASHRRSYAVMR